MRLLLAGKWRTGNAAVLAGAAEAAPITQALTLYLQRFPAAAKMYNIRLDEAGLFNQDDLGRAAQSIVVVRVELDP